LGISVAWRPMAGADNAMGLVGAVSRGERSFWTSTPQRSRAAAVAR
jgi:hypothetical protein